MQGLITRLGGQQFLPSLECLFIFAQPGQQSALKLADLSGQVLCRLGFKRFGEIGESRFEVEGTHFRLGFLEPGIGVAGVFFERFAKLLQGPGGLILLGVEKRQHEALVGGGIGSGSFLSKKFFQCFDGLGINPGVVETIKQIACGRTFGERFVIFQRLFRRGFLGRICLSQQWGGAGETQVRGEQRDFHTAER